MLLDYQGHSYSTIRASDLQRDGMGLELQCEGRLMAEIFFSDTTGEFTISLLEQDIPLQVIEQFIAEARTRLVPAREG